jgi:hypothetical protein
MITPEQLAQRFHESYERQAPSCGYETRKESAKPWSEVPEKNKTLMIAVCKEMLGVLMVDFADYLRDTGNRFQINADEGHVLDLVARDLLKLR